MGLPGRMEAQVNTICLLTQPQKTSQLDLKTSNTQNRQKIELFGSPTTKDLKKPQSSRQVGPVRDGDGTGERRRWVKRCRDSAAEQAAPHSRVVDKNQEGYLGSPRPDHTAQGSRALKINPHNFWL